MNGFTLKEDFLIGTASAATQIEGGGLSHSWMDWFHKGHIKDGTSPARANDHYRRWQEDNRLMGEMGMQICRFGVEWARIEPREGEYDQEALAHYAEEISLLQKQGISVLLTLHHFTHPLWFESKGAFEKKENIPYFLRFVEKVVTALGAQVNEYITINEPNVYATNGYYFGQWPPGKRSFIETVNVMSVLVAAHIAAYHSIHAIRTQMGFTDTRVSFAHHMRVFEPENPAKLTHRLFARLTERFFQGSLSHAMMKGQFSFPIHNVGRVKPGLYVDFIAVNYYTRSSVSGLRDGVRQNAPVNDLGWEIYPPGITACAEKLYAIHPLPIYITENGTCDGPDAFRSLYLYEHIKALSESDLPIKRYYHWCFCDNFEWLEGESARFGLVHIDYETQKRTVKQSGRFLQEMIIRRGVDEAMYTQYVKGRQYPTNLTNTTNLSNQ